MFILIIVLMCLIYYFLYLEARVSDLERSMQYKTQSEPKDADTLRTTNTPQDTVEILKD